MDVPVIYEDDALLVMNKPAGIVVNRSESAHRETIQDWIDHKISKRKSQNAKRTIQNAKQGIAGEFSARSGIVHRLDKETSGVLVIAKTPEAFALLKRQFMDRSVEKVYRALVHGSIPSEGEIRAPIARLPWNRLRFGVVPGGREAFTRFRRLSQQTIAGEREQITYVEIYPTTGRTHQIRVHFKYMNHPLVGDSLYAGRKVTKKDRRVVTRTMLHAWRITFTHPTTGARLVFEAPIPDDMKRMLKNTYPASA